MTSGTEDWLDEPLVRPFAVTGGRTRSTSAELDLITLVVAMRSPTGDLAPEYHRLLAACQQPVSVVEIAARVDLPLQVVKVLLSDLIEQNLVIFRSAPPATGEPSLDVLEAVLHGIRRL